MLWEPYIDLCYIGAVTRIWLNTLVESCLKKEVKGLGGSSWGYGNSLGYSSNMVVCNRYDTLMPEVRPHRNEPASCQEGVTEISSDLSQSRRLGPAIELCSTSLGGRYVMVEYQLVLHQNIHSG